MPSEGGTAPNNVINDFSSYNSASDAAEPEVSIFIIGMHNGEAVCPELSSEGTTIVVGNAEIDGNYQNAVLRGAYPPPSLGRNRFK